MALRAQIDLTKGRPEPIRALDLVQEEENGEPLVDLREVAPAVHILRPQVIPYCRKTPAEMIQQAALLLPPGYRLGVIEAWRPFQRQQRIFDFVTKSAREAFPDRSGAALKRTVCRFVAPTDHKAPPGHCTGGALDVHLVDEDLEDVDVSSPYKHFQSSATYTLGLSEEAAANRALLVETMLKVGFSNCRDEWWHYSYGDAGWAVRLGFDSCVYGKIELAPTLYEEQERLWLESFKERKNPFLEAG
jgi:D-alanyl-D-alanine dipeptidase